MKRPSPNRFVLVTALVAVAGFTAGAVPSNAG
jgi:hypothetical protein